jgi:hypothetical protein
MSKDKETKDLPLIAVGFDSDRQQVFLQFDHDQFKQWDFVVAVLKMAVAKAEFMTRKAQTHQIMAEAAQAQTELQLSRQLRQQG